LYHDVLINVTSFFREPDTFELLTQQVFPGRRSTTCGASAASSGPLRVGDTVAHLRRRRATRARASSAEA